MSRDRSARGINYSRASAPRALLTASLCVCMYRCMYSSIGARTQLYFGVSLRCAACSGGIKQYVPPVCTMVQGMATSREENETTASECVYSQGGVFSRIFASRAHQIVRRAGSCSRATACTAPGSCTLEPEERVPTLARSSARYAG